MNSKKSLFSTIGDAEAEIQASGECRSFSQPYDSAHTKIG